MICAVWAAAFGVMAATRNHGRGRGAETRIEAEGHRRAEFESSELGVAGIGQIVELAPDRWALPVTDESSRIGRQSEDGSSADRRIAAKHGGHGTNTFAVLGCAGADTFELDR